MIPRLLRTIHPHFAGLLFFLIVFAIEHHQVKAQVADTISANSVSDLIIAYEESSQQLRDIRQAVITDFKTDDVEREYMEVKAELSNYYRIDSQLYESSLSRINDYIIIFERRNAKLDVWQQQLTDQTKRLSDFKIDIARMKQRLSLDATDLPSRARAYYNERFRPILIEADSMDVVVDSKLEEILQLEFQVSQDYARTYRRIDELRSFLRKYWRNVTKSEDFSWNFNWSILEVGTSHKKFKDTLWRVGNFFLDNGVRNLTLVVIMILIYTGVRRIEKVDLEHAEEDQRPNLYASPVFMAMLVGGFFFPALYPPTTTLMYDFVLLLTYIPFLLLLRKILKKDILRKYVLFYLAFLTLKIQNLLIPLSGYSSLILIGCALVFTYIVLMNTIRSYFELRWHWIRIFNWILGLILISGIVCIIFNRLTLGRILINGSGETIAIAMILIYLGNWFDNLIEFLRKRPFFQNITNDKARLDDFWLSWHNRVYFILLILFIIAFLRNFNIYTDIRDSILTFFTEERTLGDLTFTIGGLVMFAFVLYLSAKISSTIKFLFEDKSYYRSQKRTANLSVILRFFTVTIGFLLALVVSGIPLDKITIILGALSVGIGFGLQNIVNNLISGLILIFERPIQSGDIVEVQQFMGVVKDIGIRSSVIRTYDGSEIILPNGDLISQAVINWTLNNKHRRVEVRVGIAYGSNVEKAMEVLQSVIEDREKILKLPKPVVLFDGFGDSSLDFRMLFWTNDIDSWLATRSEIMTDVYNSLAKAGIEIPFPQRDLHIKSWDKNAAPAEPIKKSGSSGTSKSGHSKKDGTDNPKSGNS